MSRNNGLIAPAIAIAFVVLSFAALIVAGQLIAMNAFTGVQATTVNAPTAATAEDAAIAYELAISAFAQGYGQKDYMASPGLAGFDEVNWYFGEGETVPAEPFP